MRGRAGGFQSRAAASPLDSLPTVIELQSVSKRYGSAVAVDEVSLEVAPGELVCLVGGSGSGKTTTLKMVNRLIEPSSGAISIAGRDVRAQPAHQLRRGIGYVFQESGLFPRFDVAGNIAVTPRLLGWPRERRSERVDELLELLQLDPASYRERAVSELSGGERQRVGLARALAAEPQVMLLDEPFGALDPATRDDLQRMFQGLRMRLELSCLFVTHDMAEALLLADRVAVLRQGRLVQVGTPAELLNRPVDEYVARMVETPKRQADAIAGLRSARPEQVD